MSATIIQFPPLPAPVDPLAPYEDDLMDAAEELASQARELVRSILGPDFDINQEARGLLQAAGGLILIEEEPGGAA